MKPYIIGETAYNHEGNIDYLKKMIDDIAEIGLNAVKFHLLLNPDSYINEDHPVYNNIKNWVFTKKQWDDIFEYSHKSDLEIVALCDDIESLKYINEEHNEIEAIELHSTGLNDCFLLEEASKFNGQVILGIGGSTVDEINYSIEFLKKREKNNIMLMYGFQSYPTDYADINLSKMEKFKELFNLPIGYADHTDYDDKNNIDISVMGAAMGINILEKHYTPDFGKERIDYHAAVGKEQMEEIKNKMEIYSDVYGDGSLSMSKSELKYGVKGPMKKSIVARNTIKVGEKITLEKVWFKRTKNKTTVKQKLINEILGQEAVKEIKKNEIIDFSKITNLSDKSSNEDFGLEVTE